MSATQRFFVTQDGLRLHIAQYGPQGSAGLPVVCLPGFSRNSKDFWPLAEALVAADLQRPRNVYCVDYRGRGLSAYDSDWQNYDVKIETQDLIDGLAAMDVKRAIFIGTSRGGLIGMRLNLLRPELMAGLVLNDIGPVIEAKGLARIRGYLGKIPAPRSWEDAADLMRHIHSAQFPALIQKDWDFFARATFRQEQTQLVPDYDVNLTKPLAAIDLQLPLPHLWPLFDALASVPLLVIRGSLSDLLSPETLRVMKTRHPNCQSCDVEGQGHAPLLNDRETINRIAEFLQQCE